MRSRTSRGAPEWSGGKDLYMGSCYWGSGKSSVFSGIVPGSFRKVPEDSRGVRRSGNSSTTSNTVAWAVGGRPSLNGPGAPAPLRPMRMGRGNPKGWGRLHLAWRPSHLPSRLPLPQIGSGGCRQPPRGTLGRSPLSPQPINRGEEGGQPHTSPWRSPPPLYTSSPPQCLTKLCRSTT